MISGVSDTVHILGTPDTNPADAAATAASGTVCPPGAGYCESTKSTLSPQELAQVQQQNAAMQMKSARANTALEVAGAIGAVLAIGAGVVYATRKK